MKRELIIGIMLAVVCGLSVKDVLDAIRCRKREEELSLRLAGRARPGCPDGDPPGRIAGELTRKSPRAASQHGAIVF